MTKDVVTLVRASKEERDFFNRVAHGSGLSLSGLVRFLIFKFGREQGYAPPTKEAISDA